MVDTVVKNVTFLVKPANVEDTLAIFTGQMENLPAFGAWLLLIVDPAHTDYAMPYLGATTMLFLYIIASHSDNTV